MLWVGTAFTGAGVVVALVLGILSFCRSGKAVNTSREANTIAVEANQIAEQANDRARREEKRSTERNDVRWVGAWGDAHDHEWRITNDGTDMALNVVAVVDVDGVRHHLTQDEVMPGAWLALSLTEVAKSAVQSYNRMVREMAQSGISYFGSPSIKIAQRVLWQTPAGLPREQEEPEQQQRL